MATASDQVRRQQLVAALRANGTLRSDPVIATLGAVPRSWFVPAGTSLEDAYADHALVLTNDPAGRPTSTISQPSMIALMLEQLHVQPGHRVLEIGTASGYTAALLAELVGPSGRVVTVELDAELALAAANRLAGRWPEVTVRSGDGWSGAPEEAPFDRVHVTVGVDDLSPHWHQQLSDGGLLVAPITLRPALELSVAFERRGEDLVSRSVRPCGFVRLRGPHATPSASFLLEGVGTVLVDWTDEATLRQLRTVLATAPVDAGSAGRLSVGWATRLALDQPHPLALLNAASPRVIRSGLHDPEDGGVALVDGGRLAGHGHLGAVQLLREQLARSDPLPVHALRITARPTDAPTPPSRWTVCKQHYSFGIDPG
ncbi:MAG TPA: protein-L-isoaspartate(D-aspartate) O-methyltransferase [Pseudonocardiaceae bacterium]